MENRQTGGKVRSQCRYKYLLRRPQNLLQDHNGGYRPCQGHLLRLRILRLTEMFTTTLMQLACAMGKQLSQGSLASLGSNRLR